MILDTNAGACGFYVHSSNRKFSNLNLLFFLCCACGRGPRVEHIHTSLTQHIHKNTRELLEEETEECGSTPQEPVSDNVSAVRSPPFQQPSSRHQAHAANHSLQSSCSSSSSPSIPSSSNSSASIVLAGLARRLEGMRMRSMKGISGEVSSSLSLLMR